MGDTAGTAFDKPIIHNRNNRDGDEDDDDDDDE